ncbi:hypothetical protein OLEAN_C08930 [Oleispira antarctica RB-8]|uniref:Uncharacterized protein n=1 Tax=Oleispira antarctica RB-8 TaxID=698738 RepID=R4YSH4_OLEAN|nr:hypothetical protein OLEAN_C08930 [Oleispira antarctica RB-8]
MTRLRHYFSHISAIMRTKLLNYQTIARSGSTRIAKLQLLLTNLVYTLCNSYVYRLECPPLYKVCNTYTL